MSAIYSTCGTGGSYAVMSSMPSGVMMMPKRHDYELPQWDCAYCGSVMAWKRNGDPIRKCTSCGAPWRRAA